MAKLIEKLNFDHKRYMFLKSMRHKQLTHKNLMDLYRLLIINEIPDNDELACRAIVGNPSVAVITFGDLKNPSKANIKTKINIYIHTNLDTIRLEIIKCSDPSVTNTYSTSFNDKISLSNVAEGVPNTILSDILSDIITLLCSVFMYTVTSYVRRWF
jgi:hypothetical protein